MKRLTLITLLLTTAASAFAAGGKTLVAYFSATGNTRAVAEEIARITGADIYEIKAAEPYAANPYDDSQRIQDEAYNDMRPAVEGLPSAETIAGYETIYVGSPLWWHQPAMVVCTFLESYDLSEKTIVPFMTYGATTYLNEGMQKLYKSTPASVHVPAELPEDLDPDNIREPQNDDAGIDVPQTPSQVQSWLERMGLLDDTPGNDPDTPGDDSDGIADAGSDNGGYTVTNIPGGIRIAAPETAVVSVTDTTGRVEYACRLSGEAELALTTGIHIVRVSDSNGSVTAKMLTR